MSEKDVPSFLREPAEPLSFGAAIPLDDLPEGGTKKINVPTGTYRLLELLHPLTERPFSKIVELLVSGAHKRFLSVMTTDERSQYFRKELAAARLRRVPRAPHRSQVDRIAGRRPA